MIKIMFVWKPNYQEFQELLSNEYALKILMVLSQQTDVLCAADIAKILDIHISTATKYLDLLYKNQFIDKRFVPSRQGKPTYYSLKAKEINIALNIPLLALTLPVSADNEELSNPIMREIANLYPNVNYQFNNDGLIEKIILTKRTRAKKVITYKIDLSQDEMTFMKYLPHPTMQAEPFLDICKKAKITGYYRQKSLLLFVEKLANLGIIKM